MDNETRTLLADLGYINLYVQQLADNIFRHGKVTKADAVFANRLLELSKQVLEKINIKAGPWNALTEGN
jgi:hypothetical protein